MQCWDLSSIISGILDRSLWFVYCAVFDSVSAFLLLRLRLLRVVYDLYGGLN